MIIRTASFRNLHGHLNLKLSFQPGVNILIGVNGSGKTSILNALAWVLSPASVQGGLPASYLLSRLRFDEITIEYSVPGEQGYRHVAAKRSEDYIVIKIDGIEGMLEIPVVSSPETIRFSAVHNGEDSTDFFNRFIYDQRNNLVLRYLNELPGLLYLPLDRRWAEERELPHRLRTRRSTTAGHVPISEVLHLAERAFLQEQSDKFALNEALRDSILTSLFQVESIGGHPLAYVWTIHELVERQERITTALEALGLEDARKLSEEYFLRLEQVVKKLGGQTMPAKFFEGSDRDAWIDWITEASPIANRIERLIPLVEKYESDLVRVTQRTTAFLDSVNSFILDNGKEIRFSRGYELSVKLPNGLEISSQNLSSGELQLLILFTFLYFQFDDPNQEFAVLVDEPELSLHVAWQNRYVKSVRSANPNAQFIIATHSPEIANKAEDAIIDISPKVKLDAELQ